MKFLIKKQNIFLYILVMIAHYSMCSKTDTISTLLSIFSSQSTTSQHNNPVAAYLANGSYNQSSAVTVNLVNDLSIIPKQHVTGGGTLTAAGGIRIVGNDVRILTSDITIVGTVVIHVPVIGGLFIDGVVYEGNIPGLVVEYDQLLHQFFIDGLVNITILDISGDLKISVGLTTTDNISVTSGGLTLLFAAITFSAGSDITIASGASLTTPNSLTTSSLVGNILGAGAITLGKGLSTNGVVQCGPLTLYDGMYAGGGITATGSVVVHGGGLGMTGSGLHVTNGNIILDAGTSLHVGAGGTSINGTGSFIAADEFDTLFTGAVSIASGDFSMGSGVTAFDISGGGISVGGSGIITLNRTGTAWGLSGTSLNIADNAVITNVGSATFTGGSISIGSGASITSSAFLYNGSHNSGTFFSNNGTLTTSGDVSILNTNNNNQSSVMTGFINAAGNVTISGNSCTKNVAEAVSLSGNISGESIRMNNNSSGFNASTISNNGYTITASSLLEMNQNSSQAGATAVFISGGSVTAGSTMTMSDNNAGTGSSVGVYLGSATIKSTGAVTMNHNSGTVFGVRIANSALMQTNSTCTITIDDTSSQLFNSATVAITNISNTPTAKTFSDFVITIGGTVQTSYPTLNDRVVLNVANHS